MSSARALLLIADIGGYTDYMGSHRMSLAHAEVNTGRLLETVIDAAPGFELIEIEGDAAFLYRQVDSLAPDALVAEVVRVAVAMHQAFHLEREYVARNLCPCSGCKEMANLKLKFVAHVGEWRPRPSGSGSSSSGSTSSVVHRLLKNPVTVREYVLLSEDLYATGSSVLPDAAHEIATDLQGIGRVRAFYVDVTDLDAPGGTPTLPTWRGRLGQDRLRRRRRAALHARAASTAAGPGHTVTADGAAGGSVISSVRAPDRSAPSPASHDAPDAEDRDEAELLLQHEVADHHGDAPAPGSSASRTPPS